MLKQLQEEVAVWVKRNFPAQDPLDPLLGLQEELGELCHAVLKKKQGIRLSEDHDAKIVDAVGDLVIFLTNFCNVYNIDLQNTVEAVWAEVKKRDWTLNKENGLYQELPKGRWKIVPGSFRIPKLDEAYLNKFTGQVVVVFNQNMIPKEKHYIVEWTSED